MKKKAFQKSIEKRKEKRRRGYQLRVRVGGNCAARGIQRFRSGRLLPSKENKFKTRQHSWRIAADSFRSRDPRRPLRLKVSKLLFHITDQHENIMLRERSRTCARYLALLKGPFFFSGFAAGGGRRRPFGSARGGSAAAAARRQYWRSCGPLLRIF